VTPEISLSVAVNIQPSDHAPAVNRLLPDRRMNRLPPPRDVAWKANINRHKSRHHCLLSQIIDHPKPTLQFLYDRVRPR